jgi:hypothetical protein
MKIKSEYPFDDWTCYKVFHKKMKRWQVCMINKRKERKTILFSKYLMSIKEKRILRSSEEVDHLDGNPLNDCISNLEIVTKEENRNRQKKFIKRKTKELKCSYCFQVFKRFSNLVNKNSKYCSRKCMHLSMQIPKININLCNANILDRRD